MPTVRDVLQAVETLAPASDAFSFDRCGFQVGDLKAEVTGIVCTLDCTPATLDFAQSSGCNTVIAHHPVIWDPLQRVEFDSVVGQLLAKGTSLIAAHTNWDCAKGGINDTLCGLLELEDVVPFGPKADTAWFKLVTFAPRQEAEALVTAMSAAGAGRIGLYERCAFLIPGTGTFLPLDGSDPAVGQPGKIERTDETRIEMVVPNHCLSATIAALEKTHSYEEPAYDVVPMKNSLSAPLGRVGHLKDPLTWSELKRYVDSKLATTSLVWPGSTDRVRRVAVIGGAADREWSQAKVCGADVLVTGEVRHDVAVSASVANFGIVQAGHYATEYPGMVAMAERLSCLGFRAVAFEPSPGRSGRPAL